MSLYAIGDLHLSLGTDKPMDVFGGNWNNYLDRIKEGFSSLDETDTCVLCGDTSWAMTLEAGLPDFKFLDSLPGKKIILKGNHDYWWSTLKKMKDFFDNNGIRTIEILNNNSFVVGKTAVCGTRGWFYEEETEGLSAGSGAHDKKIMAREVGRLEASLASVSDEGPPGGLEKICFLHYPPVFKNYYCREIIEVMKKHGVRRCWYGHIHGLGHKYAVTGFFDGIEYHMISADFLNFIPAKAC